MCSIGLRRVSTAVSTENATIPKSTKLRTSDSSVYRGTHSNRDCFLIILFGIRTKECEFLDSVDFGGVAFLVESTMGAATCRRKKKFRGCSIKKISGVQHKKKFKKKFRGCSILRGIYHGCGYSSMEKKSRVVSKENSACEARHINRSERHV